MVEVPGGVLPGPVDWAWPAEVPSLAGCTWTERLDFDAGRVSWTYDADGRLLSEERTFGNATVLTSYTWRRGCLTDLSQEAMAGYGTPYTNVGKLHLYSCDRHDNKVAWEHVAVANDGSFLEIDARTFVNSYDALGQLATVETWPSGGSAVAPLFIDTYTWNADGQPLVQVQQSPLEGSKTTWTWWWDHELLLGRDEEGTGADAYMARTYEDRRLTTESIDSDADGPTSTTWEYADPPGRFPVSKRASSDLGANVQIEVACQE